MIEVLDQAGHKSSKTLEDAENDCKNLITFLLRGRASDGRQLLDELDERDN